MNVLNMDHIEFYVGDARQAAQYLCTAYGFRVYGHGGPETGLPGQRSVLLGQHHIRILLTSGLQPHHPASQFVATHGDGAAVTAFRTDDAAAAFKEAVDGGGTGLSNPRTWADGATSVFTADVAGFGDVVYRLVERHGADTSFLPGAIEMVPDADAAAEDGLLRVIDHAAVCVPVGELDASPSRSRSTSRSASRACAARSCRVPPAGSHSRSWSRTSAAGPARSTTFWLGTTALACSTSRSAPTTSCARSARTPTGALSSRRRRRATTTCWHRAWARPNSRWARRARSASWSPEITGVRCTRSSLNRRTSGVRTSSS